MAAVSAAGGGAGLPGKRKCMAGALPLSLKLVFLMVALAALAAPSAAAVYKVGDSVGWTILGNPNYTAWAAFKTFHVGDTLVFEYNKQFHNVMAVSKSDYDGCKTQSPLSTYNTGNDSITLKTAGHHFFLCGFPGHCTLGQKVDVNALKAASHSPASAPAASPASPAASNVSPPPAAGAPTGPTAGGVAPPPQKSRAAPVGSAINVMGWAAALLAVAVGATL